MGRLVIPAKSWVLVCDGSKSLLFQNEGDGLQLDLQLRQSRAEAGEPTRNMATDRPGRAFASRGKGRSAVESADLHELAEQKFLKDLADELERTIQAENVSDLVIVAPARAMGVLRTCLGPRTRTALKTEIGKDLCKLPVTEIEAHLKALREIS